ncbi:hypothetical protein EW146_g6314 [Bondarzewia mesenterica]|uniref:RNB domain-containing protein n=1 Tax=Bondarzewia mesenterica TaxID=1095465 RepID=A0A4S4LUN1_9AGAM|nr:hypothetical protein EW146_g6314 [Bondarzewia mesenterica]
MHRRGVQCTQRLRSHTSPNRHNAVIDFVRARSASSHKPNPNPYYRNKNGQRNESGQYIREKVGAIIGAATRTDADSGWKHSNAKRSDELRLVNAILDSSQLPAAVPPALAANEGNEASTDSDEVDFLTLQTMPEGLAPGSFVQIRRNHLVFECIVLRDDYFDGFYRIVCLSQTGKMLYAATEDIMFTLPKFVDEDLISRCGEAERAESSPQLMARVMALRELRAFCKAAEDGYNALARPVNTLFNQVCSANPDEWSKVTLAEAMKIVAPKDDTSSLTSFCLHSHMMNRSREFVADPTRYFLTQTFYVRPRSHSERIDSVAEMIRKKDPKLVAFAEKARRVIQRIRPARAQSIQEPPTCTIMKDVTYTDGDRTFIFYLQESLNQMRTTQTDPYTASMCAIVKAVGMHPGDITVEVVRQLLIDLGVFAPWQDFASRRLELGLFQGPEEESPIVKEQNSIMHRSLSAPPSAGPLGPEDFYPSDRLESVRHDFGDLPVYVIDDYGAEELDDGLSIETIPTEPGSYWMHTHIADPTSLLPPTHIFALQARRAGESIYFQHRTWPMLPRCFMNEGMSLGDSAAVGKPERVLTFSSKVDPAGDIVDYKVRASLVRNVHVLRYDDIDSALSLVTGVFHHPFGRSKASQLPLPPDYLAPSDIENLRHLATVAERLVNRRLQSPIILFTTPVAHLSVSPRPLPISSIDARQPSIYRGYPEVNYRIGGIDVLEKGSRGIIAEAAKAASRVASRFANERGLPIVHRGSLPPVTVKESDFQELMSLRSKEGLVYYWDALRLRAAVPPGTSTLESKSHFALGIPESEGYVRVTSPLRRYPDMIAHWQIKEALLSPGSKPLFSADELQTFIDEYVPNELLRKRSDRLHQLFWATMYIHRWKEANEASSDVFKGDWQMVYLPGLGVPATLVETAGHHVDIPIGQEVRVNVDKIELGSRPKIQVYQV